MGKGEIIAELGSGEYSVKIIHGYRDKIDARIASMESQIVYLNQKISEAEDGLQKDVMILQVTSLEKQIELLNTQMPVDVTKDLWCADLSTGITGDVGLIEIPGEIASKITNLNIQSKQTTEKYTKINIQPGFEDNAAYLQSRDKEIVPVVAMSAAQMFYNKAVLPGWQKWQPTFRYGVIVADSLDFDADTCSVCLDPEYSSQQNLGVNQGDTFSECSGDIPSGFTQFCVDNPSHPTCVNTEQGGGYSISDEMLATIKEINSNVNSDHEYQTDQSGYGIGEYWTEMAEGEKGDCEDFALTKQKALYDAGIPIQHLQLSIGETDSGGWHAFLLIRSGNRGDLILDNRFENVTKLENVPYRFSSYQNAGQQWNGYGVRLADVPIEYMNCNATAFADGDEVVVGFTDQEFFQPKVIGFKENPESCDFDYYAFMGLSFVADGTLVSNHAKYVGLEGVWLSLRMLPTHIDWPSSDADWSRNYPGSGYNASSYWIFGGYKQFIAGFPPWLDYPYPWLTTWWNNLDVADRYDKIENTWTSRNTLPFPKRNAMAGFTLLGKTHLVGGTIWPENNTETSVVVYVDHDQYDDSVDSYVTKSAAKTCMQAAWAIDDKGYIFGGNILDMGKFEMNDAGNWSGVVKEYDPTEDVWTLKESTSKRMQPSFFSLPGYGYAFSGKEGGTGWIGDLDEWDKTLNVWSAKQSEPNDGSSSSQTPAVGQGSHGFMWSKEHWKWMRETDTWSVDGLYPPWRGNAGGRAAL